LTAITPGALRKGARPPRGGPPPWTWAIGRPSTGSSRSHQSLIWPKDNIWCVATEVDFDSTLITGERHLIDAVLGAEDLEAMPIEPSDCLESRGDTVNV
jgi:hypothetical protein